MLLPNARPKHSAGFTQKARKGQVPSRPRREKSRAASLCLATSESGVLRDFSTYLAPRGADQAGGRDAV